MEGLISSLPADLKSFVIAENSDFDKEIAKYDGKSDNLPPSDLPADRLTQDECWDADDEKKEAANGDGWTVNSRRSKRNSYKAHPNPGFGMGPGYSLNKMNQ